MIYLDVLYYNANFSAILWSLRKVRRVRSFDVSKKAQNWDPVLKRTVRSQYAQLLIFSILFILHTSYVLYIVWNSIISIGLHESLKQNYILVILCVLGFILSVLYHLDFHKEENSSNSTTEINSIDKIKADKICIYLRSFVEDSYYVTESVPHPFLSPLFGQNESLDSAISKTLKNEFLIVKFSSGKIGKSMSDWMVIESIENWKEEFTELLKKSNLVIVKPGFSQSLRWEIRKIIDGNFLSKTVFLDTYGPDRIINLEALMKNDFFAFLKADYGFEFSPLPKYNFFKRMFPSNLNCYTIKCGFIKHWDDIKSAVNSLD